MPSSPAHDPANGDCTATAIATERFTYSGELVSPDRKSASNGAIYLNYETYPTASIKPEGVFTHSYGIEALEYRWDDDPWKTVSDGKMLDAVIPANFEEGSSHILVIRVRAAYGSNASSKHSAYVLGAVIYVRITPPPSVTVTYEIANTTTTATHFAGNQITLPTSESADFAGWMGSDGAFFPMGASLRLESDLRLCAIFLDWKQINGAALSISSDAPHLRFSALVRGASYDLLGDGDHVQITARWCTEAERGEPVLLVPSKTRSDGSVRFDLDTPTIANSELDTPYWAEFTLVLSYSDGTTRTLSTEDTVIRTAREVAASALADPNGHYSAEERAELESIINSNLLERNPA
jgi:hypothetical protein